MAGTTKTRLWQPTSFRWTGSARDHAPVSSTGGAFHGVTDDALARLGRSRRIMDGLHTSELIAVAPQKLLNGPIGLAVFEPPTDHLLDQRSRAAASGGCGNRFLPPSSGGWLI
jgi:hypothetical protein